ncbi:MAG: tryptophan 7-halogenase [Flavobacteriales bacterium]|nr:tryptophan 7-halogenase [Flavobacteriales bacterium]
MNKESVDVLVIGAGPSGTVAASIINKQGYKVKIVEKTLFPRFVIGESLLPRCMEHFKAAGFMPAIEAAGFQKKYGAVFKMGEKQCDFDFSEQYTDGWKWTWQVPRDKFDKVIADAVEEMGVPIDYLTTVTDVEFTGSNSITTVEDKDGNRSQIEAKYIVDGSGYGRVLPRLLDLEEPSDFPVRAAMFTQIEDVNRPDNLESNRITVVAHTKDFWVWMIPFSNGETSIGYVGYEKDIKKQNGNLEEQFRAFLKEIPQIPVRFHESEFVFEPKQIMGYSAAVKQLYGDGYVLTGNSTEFLDPVFSSGVTFATESARIAGELICKELDGEPQNWEIDYTKHLMQGVDTFRTYVYGWYDGRLQSIFFSDHIEQGIKNKICSVLAGYVWDKTNPFVRSHDKSITNLSNFLKSKTTQV